MSHVRGIGRLMILDNLSVAVQVRRRNSEHIRRSVCEVGWPSRAVRVSASARELSAGIGVSLHK